MAVGSAADRHLQAPPILGAGAQGTENNSGLLDEIPVSWKAESHSSEMQHLSAPTEQLQAGLTSESGTPCLKSFQPLS